MAQTAMNDARSERETVASRRGIVVPSAEKTVSSRNEKGEPIKSAQPIPHGPGQEVTLPAAEIAHLRRARDLVDPNAAAAELGPGPSFTEHGAGARAA